MGDYYNKKYKSVNKQLEKISINAEGQKQDKLRLQSNLKRLQKDNLILSANLEKLLLAVKSIDAFCKSAPPNTTLKETHNYIKQLQGDLNNGNTEKISHRKNN